MAIKIIKHGETKFKITCPVCGCEFEYEYEDLVSQYGMIKQIKCPDCGEWITHKQIFPTYPTYPNKPGIEPYDPITKPYITWTTTGTGMIDCDKCPNKPDPTKIVVGDTPCTWCKKNVPYCYTGDKFPEGYTGGSCTINSDIYKDATYVTTANPTIEVDNVANTNYTTDMGKIEE